MSHKGEDGHSSQGRFRQWQDDFPEDPKGTAPVDNRGFVQFPGNCQEELTEQEDIEGSSHGKEGRHR